MTGLRWYAHELDKYDRKTAHLSMLEHGAYRLLLDAYYKTGKPLPAIAEQLYRVCRAVAEQEQAAIMSVVSQFFELKRDGYHNETADEELAKAAELSKKRSNSGKMAHVNAAANEPAKAEQLPGQKPTHLPTTVTVSKKEINLLNGDGKKNGKAPGVTIKDPIQRVAIFQQKLAAFIGRNGHDITTAAMNLDDPNHDDALKFCRSKAIEMGAKDLPWTWPLQHMGNVVEARALLKSAADRMRARAANPNHQQGSAA